MTENYKVLALKYRPQTFEEVIGQEVLVKTLTNSISNNKIHHAFILTGIRGVGKTTTARLIAKSLNCVGEDGNGKETIKPCLKCHHCIDIANGVDQDVIEFDAASNTGVDAIRDIIDNVGYAPINARYKIYIIDEVHMLSTSAFNALLKTLEEPPPYVKFIFATTEIRKVPITILSRCIRFDLNRISSDVLAEHLLDISKKEGFELQGKSANIIANSADGSVRDSLSLLDRIIAFNDSSNVITEETVINILGLGGKEKIYDLYSLLMKKDINALLRLFDEIYLNIVSFDTFLADLLNITHMLLLSKSGYKDCNGTCIASSTCCGGCPSGQECKNGSCQDTVDYCAQNAQTLTARINSFSDSARTSIAFCDAKCSNCGSYPMMYDCEGMRSKLISDIKFHNSTCPNNQLSTFLMMCPRDGLCYGGTPMCYRCMR